jgi:hypothetical protein
MKAGPKAAVEPSSLPFRPRSAGSARFALFCQRFILARRALARCLRCGCGRGRSSWWAVCSTRIRSRVRRGGCCRAVRASRA